MPKKIIFGVLYIIAFSENCAWTGWKDRDDPGGNYDNEIFGNAETPGQGCNDLLLEARVKGSLSSFRVASPADVLEQTGEVVVLAEGPNASGLSCKNSDQTDGRCEDYEVRFCCSTGDRT